LDRPPGWYKIRCRLDGPGQRYGIVFYRYKGFRVFTISRLCVVAGLALLAGSVLADEIQGDAVAGRQKAQVCAACHGPDGNSLNPIWPKIAGQGERYMISQLKAFKGGMQGTRRSANAALMYPMASSLSDQDMADIAAWYASQKPAVGAGDDILAKKGAAIYRGGSPGAGAAACIGCHGPAGKGNAAAGFPALGGQHAVYTQGQLQAFHDGLRNTDPNNMMRNVVHKMSIEEMQAVAEYIQGLH
jgi:cytochrome c553